MNIIPVNLGIAIADAENVAIRFAEGDLTLTFVDWQERPCELIFSEVLAFRWQEFDEEDLRDDTTYEVRDSPWLNRQALLQAEDVSKHAHYKLSFNTCGSLDILALRFAGAAKYD